MVKLLTENMKTPQVKPQDVERRWFLVDADGLVLGRVAAAVAQVLRGKHKATFTPYVDCGDGVIIVNAEKIRLTGKKAEQKTYFRHSGYIGGGKLIPFARMIEKRPEWVVKRAVRGMLPKNTLGRQMVKKLRVYAGPEHPHRGLATEPLSINA